MEYSIFVWGVVASLVIINVLGLMALYSTTGRPRSVHLWSVLLTIIVLVAVAIR